jgi:hypothetical protein
MPLLPERCSRRMEQTWINRSQMPLAMRPTGLGSGIDKDRRDYTVYTGEWEVGRIYQTRDPPSSSSSSTSRRPRRSAWRYPRPY